MDAGTLASNIGQFINEHRSDRSAMPLIQELSAIQRQLSRVAGVKDKSNPSPGSQAAQRGMKV
jgi:hypothetical protein